MYEYHIWNKKNEEEDIIFGYWLEDALEKHHLLDEYRNGNIAILSRDYID